MSLDTRWMQRALELARRGVGNVHPNPLVGCVLVRGGKIVGEGYHHAFGCDHAEINAIRRAGPKALGATLYVNLEPCSHWGKTPPCVIAIVASGIRRVVSAMQDPNPRVSGKGFEFLRKHRVQVTIGVLEDEARELNRAFLTWVREQRPYVTLKAAVSLDGRTATVTGDSKWITGKKSRQAGWQMRTQVDAIAVGAGTVLKDDPSLTAHGLGRNPVRLVFAGRRSIPQRAKIFGKEAPTWLMKNTQGPTRLRKALTHLAKRGITHVLVEGGQTLQSAFLEAGLVDEVVWFIAPIILGKAKRLKDALRLRHINVKQIGDDWCLEGRIRSGFRA